MICGSMFSGKTEELIRRLNRARLAQMKIEIFKPALDTRYHEADVPAITSVAAARGLNEYSRVRKDKKSYAVDYDALDKMESINISENEALRFIEEGVGK